MVRPDLILSYWIFAWFLLYMLRIIPYNPKWILLFALIENIGLITYLILNKSRVINIIGLSIMVIIMKIFPLWYSWNKPSSHKDIIFFICLVVIYLLWLHINHKNFLNIYFHISDSLLKSKNDIPLLTIMKKLRDFLRK